MSKVQKGDIIRSDHGVLKGIPVTFVTVKDESVKEKLSKHPKVVDTGEKNGELWIAIPRKLPLKDFVAASFNVLSTGEMTQEDIEKGGDYYDERIALESICKKAGVDCKVKPFDTYQGPYALIYDTHKKPCGKLWWKEGFKDSPNAVYYFESSRNDIEDVELDGGEILEFLAKFTPLKLAYKNSKGPMKSSDKNKSDRSKLRLIKSALKEFEIPIFNAKYIKKKDLDKVLDILC